MAIMRRLDSLLCFHWPALLSVAFAFSTVAASAQESLWLEAEHFDGIRGYCWPMGRPEMKKTAGNWGLSGPGWAAEWNQGGESGFLSIATAADDDKAVVVKTVEIPIAGTYHVWVRYGDWREKTERFQIQIEQPGQPRWEGKYGDKPVVEEDNEMKLYWNWAFGWGSASATLQQGAATIKLLSTTKDPEPRQVDVIVLTTDESYRPLIKDRPKSHAWTILDGYRRGIAPDLEPLARRRPNFKEPASYELPAAWKLHTFKDKGFLYLWNMTHTSAKDTWLGDKPDRVKFPYNVADNDVRESFEKKYAARDDVPIFSDPRIVPTFHGSGPGIFATDPRTGEVLEAGKRFAKWLDQHPDRPWAMMMNYHPDVLIGEQGIAQFQKYRDRYVGSIAGESLGYFYPDVEKMKAATDGATTRRQLLEAFAPLTLGTNREKYQQVFGRDLDPNPYLDVISCLSTGNIVYAPLCADWGARTIGYESAAASSSILPMRWAFMRGAARQWGNTTATYRSCNFGDSSTIFSDTQSYHSPKNILDNYYSVFSGAGMTWYKFDIWYQYMAGSSMFYHEQGFDEFWRPGGTTAAGIQDVQLSPKGKLVDRFLRLTAAEPDRGNPYTPIAFLVDYAHGWEPAPFWPNSFKNWHGHQERFLPSDHEKMLEQYFWTAYHPIGPESEKPITGTNEVNVPGVYGDIFDVIYAYPDATKWRTIDSYPVVIAAGDIDLTEAEGQRLADYVDAGGTLVVADSHLTGPGAAALKLPASGASGESSGYRWSLTAGAAATDAGRDAGELLASQRYRFKEIAIAGEGTRALATTPEGKCFCAAIDRGAGRIVYLSVPRGLGVDKGIHPVVPRLIAHLSRGLMPLQVSGEVEWLVNRTTTGWAVTLLNASGQDKPQQGITPTDYRENKSVTIQLHVPITTARDRLQTDEAPKVENGIVKLEVPAGGVRIVELK
jgi:hypothetical protein